MRNETISIHEDDDKIYMTNLIQKLAVRLVLCHM
jgi:hypothetical protein